VDLLAVALALDQELEPERPHAIERLLCALELLGLETAPLRQLTTPSAAHLAFM
jgi:hypothetical protein